MCDARWATTNAAIRASGGGLLRNLQPKGLREAAPIVDLQLDEVITRTEQLAREWEALPDADDLAFAVRGLHARAVETVEILKALLL